MGKTLSIHLTSLLVVLPILCGIFNISVKHDSPAPGKDINPNVAQEANYHIRTVVIDPGHGGKDGGCTGATHSIEKHLALDMALKLGQIIKANYPDIRVIYTRDRDVFVPLHRRAEIANKNKADLFISIHCNNILNAAHVHGSETYVMGLHRAKDNLKVAKRENQAILMEENYQNHYDGYDPNSAEGHIILSFVQNAYLEQSILFAQKVEKHIHRRTGRKSRGVKQAGFLVLRNTTMPSVLIEAGYLSNTSDEAYLLSEHGKQQVANAIYHAFAEYKYEMESSPAAPQLARQTLPPNYAAKSPVWSQKTTTTYKATPNSNTAYQPARERPATTKISSVSSTDQPSNTTVIKRPSRIIPMTASSPSPPSRTDVITTAPVFMVQLASANYLLNTKTGKWNRVSQTIEVKREKGLYKYLATGFTDLSKAISGQQSLRSLGFHDAFVVAYQNGQRISLARAKSWSK